MTKAKVMLIRTITNVKKLGVILFILLLGACGKGEQETPAHILSGDILSEILVDVHIAEASIQTQKLAVRDSIAKSLYSHLFRIHQIQEKDFYDSMEYYGGYPKKLQKIYAKTTEKLKEKEEALKKKRDSNINKENKDRKGQKNKAPH